MVPKTHDITSGSSPYELLEKNLFKGKYSYTNYIYGIMGITLQSCSGCHKSDRIRAFPRKEETKSTEKTDTSIAALKWLAALRQDIHKEIYSHDY